MTTLTDTFLASSKRRQGEEHYDANGLMIRCGKKGHTWAIKTRNKRETIGHYPRMSIKEARAIAEERADRLARGVPAMAIEVAPRGVQLTIENLLDRYERARQDRGQDIKSLKPCMQVLRNGFKDHARLDVAAFGKLDMRAAHSAMSDGGRHANGNLFLRYASAMFKWAIYEDLATTNWAGPEYVKRAKVQPRDRVLTMAELAAIWRASERYAAEGSDQGRASRAAYARMLRFLMLTGQRLSEAADLRYGDIVAGQWTQTENKMSRVHRLRLPEAALAEVDIGHGTLGRRVFTSATGERLNNFQLRLDAIIELSGVADWSHHTLRHTLVTQLGEAGVSLEVREAVINHKLVGMAGVYNHANHESAKRDALKLWAEMIAAQFRICAAVA